MWPWEHAILAYLLYSLAHRALGTRVRGRSVVVLLVIGAVLPDLIDKPLAWHWDVFATGYAIGHSIFFAIPLTIVAILIARHLDRIEDGVAFSFGYLSHLLGDLVSPLIRLGEVPIERILWPISTAPPSHEHESFTTGVRHYLDAYGAAITAGEPDLYLIAQTVIALLAITLWIVDGYPGVARN